MKIQVTQEDIKKGIKNSQGCCPIAHAIRRQLQTMVWVDYTECLVGSIGETEQKNITLPWQAQHFVYAFDSGENVQPFEFELPL